MHSGEVNDITMRDETRAVVARSRIAIVEDHALLAETVGLALGAEGFDVLVADLTDEQSALTTMQPNNSLLVLLDLELCEPIRDGASLIPSLRASGAAVLVVSGTRDRARLGAALSAGAIGVVAKDAPFEDLLDAVRRAAVGGAAMPAAERQELIAHWRRHQTERSRLRAPFQSLTPRESQVLGALSEGKSVETIAAEWVVSPATVRTQVRGVLTKLDVRSQLAAVAKAQEAGWRPNS